MEIIELKAYGKINLGLDVLRRREDGYHELKMIMQTVDLYDEIYLEKIDEDKVILTTNIEELEVDNNNLVCKAINLMRSTYGIKQGVKARLIKNIPIAAGMAGGSADCATTLRGMRALFGIDVSDEELRKLGKSLGADVPYCVMGGTVLAEGIGEELCPLPPIEEGYVVIAKPNISVSTKYVYEGLHLDSDTVHPDIDTLVEAIRGKEYEILWSNMDNILETVTTIKYPVINDIKEYLMNKGATCSLMSGSGPTVFAIFKNKEDAKNAIKRMNVHFDLDKLCVTRFINPVF